MSRPLQSIRMAYSTCNQNNLRMSQSYLWREIQDLLLISKNLRQYSVNHKMRMGSTVWPNNSSISKTRNSTVLFVKLTFRYAVQFLAVIKSKDVAVSFSLVKVSEYWKCTLHLWKRIFFWVQDEIQTRDLSATSHWGTLTDELQRNSREILSGTQNFVFFIHPLDDTLKFHL